MASKAVQYSMILLEETPPRLLAVRGAPMVFRTREETVEYAKLHGVTRWMITGDPEGWWPVYTPDGPVQPLPEPKARVDISLPGPGRPKAKTASA